MPDEKINYFVTGYDGKVKRHIVKAIRNGVPLYEYKCKIQGNLATLYPVRRLLATEEQKKPIEISIFDLQRRAT